MLDLLLPHEGDVVSMEGYVHAELREESETLGVRRHLGKLTSLGDGKETAPQGMTKRRLRKLYEVVRVAAHAAGILICDEGETAELADALDEFIEECDTPEEARLVEWAMDNGYPDFETVLEYAR